jgi:pyruvate/2-oxoglutarate dehydrogenase complex dihydrolipoamide dehydrogenase (E3) component
VTVDLAEGGEKKLSAKNIIVATGSDVIGLPFLPVRPQFSRLSNAQLV